MEPTHSAPLMLFLIQIPPPCRRPPFSLILWLFPPSLHCTTHRPARSTHIHTHTHTLSHQTVKAAPLLTGLYISQKGVARRSNLPSATNTPTTLAMTPICCASVTLPSPPPITIQLATAVASAHVPPENAMTVRTRVKRDKMYKQRGPKVPAKETHELDLSCRRRAPVTGGPCTRPQTAPARIALQQPPSRRPRAVLCRHCHRHLPVY